MTTDATYTAPAGIYGPVEDWATDIDHADPAYNPRAPEIWAELRERGGIREEALQAWAQGKACSCRPLRDGLTVAPGDGDD